MWSAVHDTCVAYANTSALARGQSPCRCTSGERQAFGACTQVKSTEVEAIEGTAIEEYLKLSQDTTKREKCPFTTCTLPNAHRWRGNDIVFSTDDCLVCALPIKSERRARPNRADTLMWAFRTPTPLHGMRPHPQIQHGPFFAVSADMRVLQVVLIVTLHLRHFKDNALSDALVAKKICRNASVVDNTLQGRVFPTPKAALLVCAFYKEVNTSTLRRRLR